MNSTLPSDPMILLSVLNTKLRDCYSSFAELCEDMDLDETQLTENLRAAGFDYDPARNQFR